MAVRVNPVVRLALYFFVISIPFEMPERPLPLEVPTLTGLVALLAGALLHPSVAFRRIPWAVRWFGIYLWIFLGIVVIGANEHTGLSLRLFAHISQSALLLWMAFNLMADARVVRGVLIAIVVSCTVRACLQWLGIGETARAVYTGGERVTLFGQNANLSAIILSVGLVTVIGLHATRARWLPRAGLLAWPLAALMGIAIIQTGSRGGLACAAAGLLVLAFRGRTPARVALNVVAGAIGITALIWGALQSDVMRARIELTTVSGDLAGREVIYPAGLAMFVERPLLGWGPIDNQFEIARRIQDPHLPRRDAHNLVLELVTATGIVGAVPFLIGLGLIVRAAWRARHGALGSLPLAMLATVFMGSVSGTWIASKILWLSMAIALAAGTHWVPVATQRLGGRG
ncbi:MAG TPA: O-antigen ligase family protein [Gemmatimonadaceae bacterium]